MLNIMLKIMLNIMLNIMLDIMLYIMLNIMLDIMLNMKYETYFETTIMLTSAKATQRSCKVLLRKSFYRIICPELLARSDTLTFYWKSAIFKYIKFIIEYFQRCVECNISSLKQPA